MADENNTGGSAFPIQAAGIPGALGADPGMTLRDWFAGQAMNHMLEWTTVTQPATFKVIAEKAYLVADAMIEARDATPAQSEREA